MSLYTMALYLHRLGALGLFIALGLEWFGVWRLRRAVLAGQARHWLRFTGWTRWAQVPFMAVLPLSGGYMAYKVWGLVPWVVVALGALGILIVVSLRFIAPALAAVRQALPAGDEAASPSLRQRLLSPALWIATQVRTTTTLGIVFLMIAKPGWGESLLAIVVAVAIGLAVSLPAARYRRAQKNPAI